MEPNWRIRLVRFQLRNYLSGISFVFYKHVRLWTVLKKAKIMKITKIMKLWQ